jgi:diguanylate cyclase (GGDEF)-like protein
MTPGTRRTKSPERPYQTSEGYLWPRTAAGLIRFDGVSLRSSGCGCGKRTRQGHIHNDGRNDCRPIRRYIPNVSRTTNALVLALLVLTCGVLRAQEYNFRYFGVTEGLNNLAVRQIYQDRVGFIWVSTENGIFRYDGERFEAFGPEQGIPSTSGAAFGDAPDGSLLVGGNFGLYNLSGNRFKKLPFPFKTVSWAQGIQSDGKGHTFIGTDSGLLELYSAPEHEGFVVRRFPQAPGTSGPSADGVLADGDILWYGCGDELCRIDRSGTTVLGRDSGLPDRVLLVIRKDRVGNLWVRAQNAGVFVLPVGQTKFRRPNSPIPSSALVGVPAIDADGRILLPSPDGLLIRDDKGWPKIDRSGGLRGAVYSAFEDRQHSLWIGLVGRGLAQWRGYREWESYSAASGLASDIVYEVLPRADGSLWVATEGGLFRGARRESGILWKKVAGLGGFPVHSLQMASSGDLWIGTETHGAACIHMRTGRLEWFGEGQGLSGKAAYTLRFDREQRLWTATEAGLFVAKAPYQKFSRITELPSTRFWAIAEGTDGTMWAGGAGGLFQYAAGHWKNYTRANGLSNQEVLSLGAGANGTMWIGYRYGGGIDRIHPLPSAAAIEKAVQRPGTNGIVYFLEFDASGRLWAGTERGVDMWDGSHWSHYDTSDGLAWDDCDLNAFAEEADGTVWIGTSGGLSRFKPRPHRSSEEPLDVVFTKLVIGGTDASGRRNPSFPIHSNSLVARYSALNADRENAVVFRYQLEGANSTWAETTQRELQFAELAPGTYRLDIEARGSDGVWSDHRAEFPFEILTPWYRTWWFAVACGLIPLSAAAGLLRLRMLSAQRRERELLRLVEEKTVDLQRANEDLLRLSSLDPLTGLANRRLFDQILERECARLKRTGSAVSLLILDVDHFKELNDSQGHQRGDEYLVFLGAELTRLARRETDLAARYGGEEFAVILPETSTADAARIAEAVRLAIVSLKLPHAASPVAPILTVSLGVATATLEWHSTPEELVAAADQALYAAKRSGRNRVEVARRKPVPLGVADISGQ